MCAALDHSARHEVTLCQHLLDADADVGKRGVHRSHEFTEAGEARRLVRDRIVVEDVGVQVLGERIGIVVRDGLQRCSVDLFPMMACIRPSSAP